MDQTITISELFSNKWVIWSTMFLIWWIGGNITRRIVAWCMLRDGDRLDRDDIECLLAVKYAFPLSAIIGIIAGIVFLSMEANQRYANKLQKKYAKED